MFAVCRSLTVIFGAGVILAGCAMDAVTYTLSRYGEVQGVRVRLGCSDTYEVFDRPDSASLLIVTNGLTEALSACGEGEDPPRDGRMIRIARIYLEETSARPQCRILGQTDLTPLHTEVTYRCAVPEKADAGRRR